MSEVLTTREVEQVILAALAAAEAHGRAGLTRAELERAVTWATEARITATLLAQVLAGRIGPYPAGEEMAFGLLTGDGRAA